MINMLKVMKIMILSIFYLYEKVPKTEKKHKIILTSYDFVLLYTGFTYNFEENQINSIINFLTIFFIAEES